MTLCVTSEPEMEKCVKMKVRFILYIYLRQELFISILRIAYLNALNFNILHMFPMFVDCFKSSAAETRITLSQRPQPNKLYAIDTERVRVEICLNVHVHIYFSMKIHAYSFFSQ